MSDKKIQTCSCLITLRGGKSSVYRTDITAPEILVLQGLHGPASVTDVVQGDSVERSSAEEKSRLVEKYQRFTKKTVEDIFPGFSPAMARSFKEVGVEADFAPDKPIKKGNIAPVVDGKADVPSKEEIEAMAKSKSNVTKQLNLN